MLLVLKGTSLLVLNPQKIERGSENMASCRYTVFALVVLSSYFLAQVYSKTLLLITLKCFALSVIKENQWN